MYTSHPTIVFGFHACCREVGEGLINGSLGFHPSENKFDWLGHGMYFWENSPHRARRYAEERGIEDPVVIGAAIHLGYCLDLLDSDALDYLRQTYQTLKALLDAAGTPLPVNRSPKGRPEKGDDLLLRDLDCAVINLVHSEKKKEKDAKGFDTVRAAFWEGEELYPGAGFKEKNHIQISVRNPNCIKGFFWPREEDGDHPLV